MGMNRRKMIYVLSAIMVLAVLYSGWRLTSRSAYETAEYQVLRSDGAFEIREYPELELVITNSDFASQGNDGSFMRLFRYIEGANRSTQKVSMTTPVLMKPEQKQTPGQMGFVIPRKLSTKDIPEPLNEEVKIQKRRGGRFAVLQFSGRLNQESVRRAEQKLRDWAASIGVVCQSEVEYAGYDPPWTPGPLRRNEVLIRLN